MRNAIIGTVKNVANKRFRQKVKRFEKGLSKTGLNKVG